MSQRIVLVVCGVLGLSAQLLGCKGSKALDPTDGVPKATIADARTEPSVGTPRYEFSDKDSSIQFVGSNLAATQEGKFTSFRGSIAAPDSDPAHATVSLSVDVASIQTASADLTKHLLSADFLDAAKYPTLKFTSTAISPDKAGYRIDGVFEMHGIKKQISFPAELTLEPNAPTAKAQFALDRQAFDVSFKGAPDNLIRDHVLVRFDIKAKPVGAQ